MSFANGLRDEETESKIESEKGKTAKKAEKTMGS